MSPTSPSEGDSARAPGKMLDIVLIVICQSMTNLALGGLALFLPLIRRDVGIDFSEAGSLATVSTLVYAAMQIPIGYMTDRFGSKPLFIIGLLGTTSLSLIFAFLDSYHLMLANQAISGFFRALLFAPGIVLITAQFPPERKATAMGLFVAGGFSSNIFLNLLGPFLVDSTGWRLLFVVFSGGGAAITLVYWVLSQPTAGISRHDPVRFSELRTLLKHRVLWLCGAVQFVRLAVVHGLSFWLPSLLVEDRGLSLKSAGVIVAVGAALTAPANFFGGYAADRLGRPASVVVLSLATLAFGTAMMGLVKSIPLLIAVTGLNSIFVQLYFGPLFAIPIQVFGTRTAGLVTGFSNFCANLGAVTLIFAVGLVKDLSGSFAIGMYMLSGICVLGLLCSLPLLRPSALLPKPRSLNTHADALAVP